jgi:hypothetical protein
MSSVMVPSRRPSGGGGISFLGGEGDGSELGALGMSVGVSTCGIGSGNSSGVASSFALAVSVFGPVPLIKYSVRFSASPVAVSAPVCGDRVRLSLIVRDAKIESARYLAYGCPPTLVCGSVLTELIRGKSVADARKLTRSDLLNAIGGLPSRKQHAAALAIETLNAALHDF